MFSNEMERQREGGERGGKQNNVTNKQTEYVARMEEMRKSENLKGRDHRTMHRYKDNIKMNLKEQGARTGTRFVSLPWAQPWNLSMLCDYIIITNFDALINVYTQHT